MNYTEMRECLELLINEDPNVTIRTNYCGRGMYGAACIGFVTDTPLNSLFQLGMIVGDTIGIRRHLPEVQQDSMGSSTIVYFPSIRPDGS